MRRELIHDDGGFRDLIHVSAEEIDGALEACKMQREIGATGDKEMPKLASYPTWLVEQYCIVNGITFAEWMQNPVHVQRMLRDPQLSGFRVDERKVGRVVE